MASVSSYCQKLWRARLEESGEFGFFVRHADEAADALKHTPNKTVDTFLEQTNKLASNAPRVRAGLTERVAAAGAQYPKQVEQALRMAPDQLQKSVKSLTENIAKHQDYLKNPQSHVPNWNQLSPQHQQNLMHHWHNDIAREEGYRDIAEGVLGGILK